MCDTRDKFSLGIDIGSTTVKVVLLDINGKQIYEKYQRHFADVRRTTLELLKEAVLIVGDAPCTAAVTGSGGLNLAKYTGTAFVQEVIAVTAAVQENIADADVVIELGGEDAKIIFLKNGVEQRMNGICAGGTGAFIDQMASLLQADARGLNEYAKAYTDIYPIAARCGVFAKSDIQPLINDGASKENLAASIFQAVVNQTVSGLACGRKISGRVVFLGGPLHFLPELRNAFVRTLDLKDKDAISPENAHLFAALGAALRSRREEPADLGNMIRELERMDHSFSEINYLPALFSDEEDYRAFLERQGAYRVETEELSTYEGDCYLGIDAGSTTMKLVLLSDSGKVLDTFYGSNRGDPVMAAKEALGALFQRMNPNARIVYSCSTGYGEELMKNAFSLDMGEVETIAHYQAARYFEPDVDCILDIGGQDMKCIRIKDGNVDSIILNEACSSGCGSFIESFANSLGYTVEEFAQKAVRAKHPVDLGTRCTVFMNSNVKEAQKEGVEVEDIAAGLAYSVVKNALFKVIKLADVSDLGKKIVVQGGTFYNDAVLRGFELVAGTEAVRSDIAGLMGAFGAALAARECYQGQETSMLTAKQVEELSYSVTTSHCKGCQNNCRLTVNSFSGGRSYLSGNRCERGQQKEKRQEHEPPNLFAYKRQRIFGYEPLLPEQAYRGTVGIPRVLNLYENYPFWAVFFRKLGFRVMLSPFSNAEIYRMGMDSIPSETECYPAKLTHGHIEWLVREGADVIFYPCVYYERKESDTAQNNFNCPVVTSYPENIKNNVDNLTEKNVRYINPFLSFADEAVLEKELCGIMHREFRIGKREVREAVRSAWDELRKTRADILREGERTLRWMEEHDTPGIVLAGRPYHLDPQINHGIPEMIQGLGFAVLTEDSIAGLNAGDVKLRATNQWVYHARLYAAAQYTATRKDLELIQLNSFGCGIDAVTIDQVQELLEQAGKMYTLLKIDEVSNLGAAKIRVRSMIAAMKMRKRRPDPEKMKIRDYERREYTEEMQKEGYTILCTGMTETHFDFFEAAMRCCGYRLVMLKNESPNVQELGLKYVNNDACYPALIVTGQILDAVMSGKYDTDRLAVMTAQTGGGCRASNYVGFIRRALKNAGYPQIPVISVNAGGMEKNSGLHYTVRMGLKCLQSLIYGDVLMKVLYRMRPYELEKGSANRLYDKWHDICIRDLLEGDVDTRRFYKNCREMIREFDALAVDEEKKKPKVGIVGEVLVKYMPLANNHLVEQLEEEGAEVILPDFIEFLEYCFWNSIYRHSRLGGSRAGALVSKIAILMLNRSRRQVIRELRRSRHFDSPVRLRAIRRDAQKILQLGNQCGEGWFLPGEAINLIRQKINNIVCVQPFGCLPNHIVGKGIVKKLKELYPQSNIAVLDYDPGASRVNQLNRIKLMMEVAQNAMVYGG